MRRTHDEINAELRAMRRCPTCRVVGHDQCSLTPGCPCCDETIAAAPAIGYEALCRRCGGTFNPAGPDDLIHLSTYDGEECGGQGDLLGSWHATKGTS